MRIGLDKSVASQMSGNREFRVEIVLHQGTGLLVAVSDDLPGLYVHGRSTDELSDRIPLAIKAILEADGSPVSEIREVGGRPSTAFVAAHRTFDAKFAA